MSDLIRVMAKPGALLPSPTHIRAFVGYAVVFDDNAPADHEVPGGSRYRIKPEGEIVPNTVATRKALRRGDILEFQAPPLAVAEDATPVTLSADAPSDGGSED